MLKVLSQVLVAFGVWWDFVAELSLSFSGHLEVPLKEVGIQDALTFPSLPAMK